MPGGRQRAAAALGVTAAGAVLAHVLVGSGPVAPAATAEPLSVAAELGLSAQSAPDLGELADLAASRSSREDQQAAAAASQAAADQAVLDQQAAAAAAAEAAAAEAAAAEAAAAEAAAAAAASSSSSAGSASTSTAAVAGTATIRNSAGPVSSRVQAAADAVVSNVPGADSITLGGTRPSAADPDGHPSGNALDYMVLTDEALGDAIVAYHRAHWDELGVEYLIWNQRMLSSPGGSWVMMEDRGGTTANHYDHVHVNYR
ncbi:hypothetical protein [Klenkia brasiliensis]|uniref:hypothetical protein n=1 Tax=Klenkia brasiliensis TaxID=333142 RepID=UPI000B81F3EA|nr:hypothetical protein [Klenkia brasiliensis]